MTKIKFCGLTRPEDIEAVNAIKPDYIGFVFAKKSRRCVTPKQAAALKAGLDPAIRAVGVFVNEPFENVVQLLENGTIDLAQLHGAEDDGYITALREATQKPVLQAYRIASAEDASRAAQSCADAVLLDTGAGTGQIFDWELVRDFPRPYFLAGGLGPQNVGQAVCLLNPAAVDVSSGIETDGHKDKTKMAAFAAAVRREDEE